MLDGVTARRWGRVEVGSAGLALTALAGEWLAHTFEYLRLAGFRGAFGSVHAYMGPTGVLLVVAALAGVHSTVRLARGLEKRLAELRRVSDGRSIPGRIEVLPPSNPTQSLSVPILAATIFATQCGLYLLQENLEACFARRGLSGLSVLGGAHASAPVVLLAVAVALVVGLWLTRREVTRLAQDVRLAEDRLRFGAQPEGDILPQAPRRAWTPIDRWGMQLWSRPPPVPRVV